MGTVATSAFDLPEPLDARCNEWRLFHGSSHVTCQSISSVNWQLDLSGTGATWKAAGDRRGVPLYGDGIYFAERITKADEYARQKLEGTSEAGFYYLMVCRV